ncbi:ubiquitin-conjugating enzyme E2 D2B-like [Hermetia illucens]|uniref:ubiquitin-conjugating enzyme E2 D2B-like n=1 Tax=Hermetia illucens TaxID=343691 RepID=UPI0018CC0BF6|nr:ubiquitin-conjugating enzyme E2 D2B-like [Hermetia illucens]
MSKPDIRTKRVPVELKRLNASYEVHCIDCKPADEGDFTKLQAIVPGPKDSSYQRGKFKVSIEFTAQYPFQPPVVKFITPIYHPNIDNAGKICLDILRLPPNGSYNPAITLESILLSIQLLLASPNPDDPLQSNIADVYKHDRETFYKNAREYTEKYATDDCEPEVKKKKTYS